MSRPVLMTPRLELVPLADEHLELEVELDSDPEVMRYPATASRTSSSTGSSRKRWPATKPHERS
jgi:RimJ/RimL family protein N-acetyltransferase